jgi:hypothetical protein
LGAKEAGDGGGGVWRWDAVSTDDDNLGTVVLPTGHSVAGRRVAFDLRNFTAAQWGIGPARAKTDNAAGFTAFLEFFKTVDEATIKFAPGNHEMDPVSVGNLNGGSLHLIGAVGQTNVSSFALADGTNDWMWVFAGAEVTFSNIRVGFRGLSRAFDGIRCEYDAGTRLVNCYGTNVKGTAWQLMQVFNKSIELRTVGCGDAANNKWAFNLTGGNGRISSDVVLLGGTENDELGWNIENCAVLRASSALKIHGGSDCECSLRLYDVRDGDVNVLLTQDCKGFDRVIIADGSSSEAPVEAGNQEGGVSPAFLHVTVQARNNIQYTGGTGVGALFKLDLANALSTITVDGYLPLHSAATGGDWTYFRITSETLGAIDLSGVAVASPQPVKYFDDQRAVQPFGQYRLTNPARALGIDSPNDSAATVEGATRFQRYKYYSNRGDFTIAHGVANASGDRYITVPFTQCISGHVAAPTGVDDRAIAGVFLPNIGDEIKIGSVMASARGILPYDAANHWELEFFHNTTSFLTLKLARNQVGFVWGDSGFPSTQIITGSIGFIFVNDAGIPQNTVFPSDNYLEVRLNKVGSPANITEVQTHVFYEYLMA